MHSRGQLNVSHIFKESKICIWQEGLVFLYMMHLESYYKITLLVLKSQAWKEDSMNMAAIMCFLGSFILIVSLLGKLLGILCVCMACMWFAHTCTHNFFGGYMWGMDVRLILNLVYIPYRGSNWCQNIQRVVCIRGLICRHRKSW